MTALANVPAFLAYFAGCVVLLGAFLVIYSWLTPINEWELIRNGNTAAALCLAGATIGFTLPLATAVFRSESFEEMVIWAAISLVLQLGCFVMMRFVRRDAAEALANGDMAEATVLAAASVVIGILNAACLT